MSFSKMNNGLMGDAYSHLQGIHQHCARQTEILEKIKEDAKINAEAEQYHWLRATANADANGNATITLLNTTGFELELISWSAVGAATSNGGLTFYLNSAEAPNLVWATAATQYNADKFSGGMVVPVNANLVAQFLSMGSGNQVWVNVFTKAVSKQANAAYRAHPRGW